MAALVNSTGPAPTHPPLLVIEIYQELKAIYRMYVDRRNQLPLYVWATPIVAACCIVFSYFFLRGILLFGPIVDLLFDLVVAFVTYKVLIREAHRTPS
jgi:TRAP-type uncharacterized transport system fused permease subunit